MRYPLLFLLLVLASAPAESQKAAASESLRFNSRGQTEKGLDLLSREELSEALSRFSSARRLDPDNPVTVFNDATAKLIAEHPDAAAELANAAAVLPPALAPQAHYNLGNAHLQLQDFAAAIESYKNALRLEPELYHAKFNLELAQRMLDRQQQQEQQGDQQENSDGEQDRESADESSDEDRRQEQPGDEESDPEPQSAPQPKSTEGEPGEPQEDSPLPDFEEQQDMTAEQAAAILEAIQNLERDQRRKRAEERAQRRARDGKDW